MTLISSAELGNRLASERARLGWNLAQFAVLMGASKQAQTQAELGDLSFVPGNYLEVAADQGVDIEFVTGRSEAPTPRFPPAGEVDVEFLAAVGLLRKSCQAVDAFVGPNASKECPALVAALMSATTHQRFAPDVATFEVVADQAITALKEAAAEIAAAIRGQD